MTDMGHQRLDLCCRFMRDVSSMFVCPPWLVLRPTALRSFGRLALASSRAFGCASRPYRLHRLKTSATARALSAPRSMLCVL